MLSGLSAVFPLLALAQSAGQAMESYFAGREVMLTIDMPGTQKGVNLKFDSNPSMNWKEYEGDSSNSARRFARVTNRG
jgi:hypothetical protein